MMDAVTADLNRHLNVQDQDERLQSRIDRVISRMMTDTDQIEMAIADILYGQNGDVVVADMARAIAASDAAFKADAAAFFVSLTEKVRAEMQAAAEEIARREADAAADSAGGI